jgi:TonB family protein
MYSNKVTKDKLNEIKIINDISKDYPSNWVTDYISVEIVTTCHGKKMKAMSPNATLTREQKNILNDVDLGTDIFVNVNYRYPNSATGHPDVLGMHFSLTAIPEIEAEYPGGYKKLMKYLKENIIDIILNTTPKQFQQGNVTFTVNEKGEIVNSKISKTSGNPETDKLFLKGINKMPKWKPAENLKGVKVNQEFEFRVGGGNDGC